MQNRSAYFVRKLNALRIAVLPEADRLKVLEEISFSDLDAHKSIVRYLKELVELEIDEQSLKFVIAELESEALDISESDETLVGTLNRYSSEKLYEYINDLTEYDLALFIYASDEFKMKKMALQRLEEISGAPLNVVDHQYSGCEKVNHSLIERLSTILLAGA